MSSLEQISSEIELSKTLIQQLGQSFEALQSQFSPAESLSHQWRTLEFSFDKIQGLFKKRAQEISKEKHLDSRQKSVEDGEKSLQLRQKQFNSDEKLVCDRCGALASFSGDVNAKIELSRQVVSDDDRRKNASVRISVTVDGKTLLMFLNNRVKEHELLGEDVYNALKLSSDPAKLVLDAMAGFFAPHLRKGDVKYESSVVSSSCVLLLEQLLKMKPRIKKVERDEAMSLAGEWREKMKAEGESDLAVLGYLLLMVIYHFSLTVEKVERRRLFEVVIQHRLADQLQPRLGLLKKKKASSMAQQAKKEGPDGEESKVAIISTSTKSSTELCSQCKNMDANGLRLYLTEHLKEQKLLHEKVLNCLRCAQNPGKLVLDVMQDVLMETDGAQNDAIKSRCNFVLEQLVNLEPDVAPSVKEQAINFATRWKARLTEESKPSENYTFLKFVAAYGLASSFKARELLWLVGSFYAGDDIYELGQNPNLCRALGLEVKIPDLIESLIEENQRLVAVRYICAFNQVDKFPPVPLLEAHLEYVKITALKTCKNFKRSIKAQNKCANRQILALQGVIKCIMDFKLESQLSRINLQQRIKQLEKEKEEINSSQTENGKLAKKNRPNHNPSSGCQLNSNQKMNMKLAPQNPEKCPRLDVQNVTQPTVSIATTSNMNSFNTNSRGWTSQRINTAEGGHNNVSSTWQSQQMPNTYGSGNGRFALSNQSGDAALPSANIAPSVNPPSLHSNLPRSPPVMDSGGTPASSVRYGLQYLYPRRS